VRQCATQSRAKNIIPGWNGLVHPAFIFPVKHVQIAEQFQNRTIIIRSFSDNVIRNSWSIDFYTLHHFEALRAELVCDRRRAAACCRRCREQAVAAIADRSTSSPIRVTLALLAGSERGALLHRIRAFVAGNRICHKAACP
jgi:hypothetical protein